MKTLRLERKLTDKSWIPISYIRCHPDDIREMIGRVTANDSGPMPIRIKNQGTNRFNPDLPKVKYIRGGTVVRCE